MFPGLEESGGRVQFPSSGRVGRGLYAMRLGKDCARETVLLSLLQITTFRSRETSESCDLLSDLLFAILGPTILTGTFIRVVICFQICYLRY